MRFLLKKSGKSFGGNEKSRTFAPAKRETNLARHKRKSSLKDLHKQTSSTRSEYFLCGGTWVESNELSIDREG